MDPLDRAKHDAAQERGLEKREQHLADHPEDAESSEAATAAEHRAAADLHEGAAKSSEQEAVEIVQEREDGNERLDGKVLLIGYTLSAARDYDAFTAALHDLGDWWHHLDNTWLICTGRSPAEVRDELKLLLANEDGLLVLDVTGSATAWTGFDDRGSRWLTEHL